MSELASLVREFPMGSLLVILASIFMFAQVASAFFNRNRPVCDCECCNVNDDDEEDSDD